MSESAAGDGDDTLVTASGPGAPEVAVDPDETLRPGSPEDARSSPVPAAAPSEPPAAVDNTTRGTHHTTTTPPTDPPIPDNAGTSAQDAATDTPTTVPPAEPDLSAEPDPSADVTAVAGTAGSSGDPAIGELSDESAVDEDPGATKRLGAEDLSSGDAESEDTSDIGELVDSGAVGPNGEPAADQPDAEQPAAEQLALGEVHAEQPYAEQPYAEQPDGEQPDGELAAGALAADQAGAGQPEATAEQLDDDGDLVADELVTAHFGDDLDDDITLVPGTPFPIDDSAEITESDRAAAIGALGAGSAVGRLGPQRQRDARKWIHVVRHGYFLRSKTGITVAAAVVLIVLTVFGLSGLLMFGNGTDSNTGEAVVFVSSPPPEVGIGTLPPELQVAVSAPPPTQSDVSAVQARSIGRVENRPRTAAPPAAAAPVNRQPQPTSPAAAPTAAPSQSPAKAPAPTTSNPSTNCWTNFPAIATLLKHLGGC